MTGEMITVIGYGISVAALILLIGGAAVYTNAKRKKNCEACRYDS